ncbi:MAG: ABA4-like family protein [Bacteroidota bacterium]
MTSPDTLFSWASSLAMLGWIILAIAPRWRFTKPIVQYGFVSILLSILYAYCIYQAMSGDGMDVGSFGSLEGVMALFTSPIAVLAGWVHYLAFDLWVGSWEVGDASRRGVPHLMVIPCLFFTFMFGPVGLLLYLIVRAFWTKSLTHENF